MAAELVPQYAIDNDRVALALTGPAFQSARRAQIDTITPNLPGMRAIAEEVGFVDERSPLNLVVVVRQNTPQRHLIGRWDSRLPRHAGDPDDNMYFSALDLSRETPRTGGREALQTAARHVGAQALTEVTIEGWDAPHIEEFAEGLLLGQRPVVVPPAPTGLGRAIYEAKGWGRAFTQEGPDQAKARAAARHQPPFDDPFTCKRVTALPSSSGS